MLKNIGFGWAELSIGDYKQIASRSTNIPFDILDAICEYNDKHECIIEFDTEKWKYDLHLTKTNAHIIEHKTNSDRKELTISPFEIIKSLYSDIKANTESWLNFISEDNDDYNSNEMLLTEKINKVETFL